MERRLLTGQVATKAGINVETLRFYAKKGLIPDPLRTNSGYRQYPEETLNRIYFIKNAKKLGFTLIEIKELLSISLETNKQCRLMKGEIEHKQMEVKDKIKKLQEIGRALKNLRKKCDEGTVDERCSILEFLYGGKKNDQD